MNYLILRNDGIGDLVVTTDSIELIKKNDKNAKITLICSGRNYQYAKILKREKHIHNLINLDKVIGIKSFFLLIKKLRKIDFFQAYILKVDNKNLFISLLSRSKYINTLLPNKLSKLNNILIYKYPLLISKFLFYKYEIINTTKIKSSNTKTMMGSHISNLISNSLKTKNKGLNYIIPKSIDISQIKNKFNFLDKNRKKIILMHIDEKWLHLDESINHIISLIDTLKSKRIGNCLLVITNGVIFTKLNKLLIKHFSNDKATNGNDLSTDFDIKKNIYFLKKTNIEELMYLSKCSSLIIHMHGALTHISSIYKTPIIDIIPNNSKKYFYKWRPNFKNYIQIETKEMSKIKKLITNLI